MLSINFQKRVFKAHAEQRPVKRGKYNYLIGYNPAAAVHTWIVRHDRETNNFEWMQPLDESIR